MIHFECDYMAGAHPEVMRRLTDTNLDKTPGYGLDPFTAETTDLLRRECALGPESGVWFLSGGTQTNATVIDALLRRCEGVMATEQSHINVHESGAIEADGHKVITLPSSDGLLDAADVEQYLNTFYADATWPHMVRPAMVYISFPSELGTLYSLGQLEALSAVCRKAGIPLYIDGARLGYALGSPKCDVTLADIARLADVFYIGGTKCGALFGEAVVARNASLLPSFFSVIKSQGALLAKGRLLAVQFETLFRSGLYYEICGQAVRLAMRIREAMADAGFRRLVDSPTNQQFFVLPNSVVDVLRQEVGFEYWGPRGEKESAVRFVTDWSTTDSDVDRLIELLSEAPTA